MVTQHLQQRQRLPPGLAAAFSCLARVRLGERAHSCPSRAPDLDRIIGWTFSSWVPLVERWGRGA